MHVHLKPAGLTTDATATATATIATAAASSFATSTTARGRRTIRLQASAEGSDGFEDIDASGREVDVLDAE